MNTERPIVFDCAGDRMVGILHAVAPGSRTGIVIAVGGPQYRIGSHRQFVHTARHLAAAGIPVLRFDYRGMGDAEGASRSFTTVDDDIRAAIDCLTAEFPALTKVVLLGLCDAASAILIFAPTDERVSGLILCNPWVRTPQGEAKAYIRHYYWQRLMQRSFWRKVASGEFSVYRSVSDFLQTRRAARGAHDARSDGVNPGASFVARMLGGLERFRRPILLLISGRDLTAKEFIDLCREDDGWRRCVELSRVAIREFPEADHTMSNRRDLHRACRYCIEWLEQESMR